MTDKMKCKECGKERPLRLFPKNCREKRIDGSRYNVCCNICIENRIQEKIANPKSSKIWFYNIIDRGKKRLEPFTGSFTFKGAIEWYNQYGSMWESKGYKLVLDANYISDDQKKRILE